ncbi:MAG: hypothetical protein GY887_15580 [Halieaceae bacterium]|nr:hypothetical protein [Halieaceae bacterium]MDG2410427.1 hypothetical protein [Halioglobus sp.]
MTGTQAIERQIVRRIVGYDTQAATLNDKGEWAERLISILTLTAGLLVVGTVFEELLWVVLGAGTLLTLR